MYFTRSKFYISLICTRYKWKNSVHWRKEKKKTNKRIQAIKRNLKKMKKIAYTYTKEQTDSFYVLQLHLSIYLYWIWIWKRKLHTHTSSRFYWIPSIVSAEKTVCIVKKQPHTYIKTKQCVCVSVFFLFSRYYSLYSRESIEIFKLNANFAHVEKKKQNILNRE